MSAMNQKGAGSNAPIDLKICQSDFTVLNKKESSQHDAWMPLYLVKFLGAGLDVATSWLVGQLLT